MHVTHATATIDQARATGARTLREHSDVQASIADALGYMLACLNDAEPITRNAVYSGARMCEDAAYRLGLLLA